jgi:glucosamine--fructose-6-phosphate aminotransferase (isomerizing)
VNANSLVIAVTQSGETADTLASIRYAKNKGAQILSVCNVYQSSIPRESHATIYMQAGAEIGVASTKAFTKMIFDLYAFVLHFAQSRGLGSKDRYQKIYESMRYFPVQIEALVNSHDRVQEVAKKYVSATSMLYIGRGLHYAIALEGSLKLKEISYIHAEGYAGGELKHGPIALIDESMPVVALAPKDKHYEKMISNIEEVVARGGQVIGIGSPGDENMRRLCAEFIEIPFVDLEPLQAILTSVPLQLLAYFIAVARGTDVDQPRNLAKSVTVE